MDTKNNKNKNTSSPSSVNLPTHNKEILQGREKKQTKFNIVVMERNYNFFTFFFLQLTIVILSSSFTWTMLHLFLHALNLLHLYLVPGTPSVAR